MIQVGQQIGEFSRKSGGLLHSAFTVVAQAAVDGTLDPRAWAPPTRR
jgi:hypothetical protein